MNIYDRQSFTLALAYLIGRRWKLIASSFFAVLLLFLFAGYLITPTWKAEVLLLAERPAQPTTAPFSAAAQPPASGAADSLATVLGGKGIAYDMVKAFGLDERLRQRAQEPSTFRDRAKIFVVSVLTFPMALPEMLGLRESGEVDWVDRAAEDFRSGFSAWLDVKVVQDTDMVSLAINGETPRLATDIANTMVIRLRERLVEASAQAAEGAREAFQQELARAKRRLDEAEALLSAFQEEQGAFALSEEGRAGTLRLQELNADSARLRGEIGVLEGEVAASGGDATLISSINVESVARSSVIQGLRSNLYAEEAQLAVLNTEFTPEHPDVVNSMEQIASLRAALQSEIDNILRGLIADEIRTQDEIAELERSLARLPSREVAMAELMISVETQRNLYQHLLEMSEQMDVNARLAVAALDFKVLDSAYVSPGVKPDSPSQLLLLLVALFAATATAVFLPVFVEYWRDPIKAPSDLEAVGIEVLGVVPSVASESDLH